MTYSLNGQLVNTRPKIQSHSCLLILCSFVQHTHCCKNNLLDVWSQWRLQEVYRFRDQEFEISWSLKSTGIIRCQNRLPLFSSTSSQQRKVHILSNHHVCGANHISVHVITTVFPSVHLLYNMLCFTNKKANTCLKTVVSSALQQVYVEPKYLQIYGLCKGHRKICTGQK